MTFKTWFCFIDFCDQRELVFSYNDKDRSHDVKPSSHKPFSRQTNGSSTTKSNKSQFFLHAKKLVHCKLCPFEKHPLYLCPEFKSRDVSSRHQTIQLLQACSIRGFAWWHHLTSCHAHRWYHWTPCPIENVLVLLTAWSIFCCSTSARLHRASKLQE